MSKLQMIKVPWLASPVDGPWRMRWTRQNGETGLNTVSYSKREDAEHDAYWCNRVCQEGATYDVVPCTEPQSARIFV